MARIHLFEFENQAWFPSFLRNYGTDFLQFLSNKTKNDDARAGALMTMMLGSYDSEAQSIADTTYFSISLEMYPIWEESGEYWLYVEQALASTRDKSDRQRVYKIEVHDDKQMKSAVYTLKEPERFIGRWNDPDFFDQFKPDELLEERTGCEVYLEQKEGGHYEGSTQGKACESTLRGASYATSTVRVEELKIESWDQGFNAEGEQVWGATKAGYVFDKKLGQ